MSKQANGKTLKGKDLITIGIFSAIYFVINLAFMLMGGLHPVMWILMPGFIALFSGIPFMLMCAKVQKPNRGCRERQQTESNCYGSQHRAVQYHQKHGAAAPHGIENQNILFLQIICFNG